MKLNGLTSITAVVLTALIFAVPAFSQETSPEKTAVLPAVALAGEGAGAPSDISIYGEVKSANAASNSISVQYYDYDKDEEKTIDVALDKDTKIENASDLAGIKQGNWADIVYVVKDGKNIARSVVIEKEEEVPPESSMVNEAEY